MDDTTIRDALQIAGWALTVVGQVQVAMKVRQGFVTWVLANVAMIALSAHAGLWWSIGMYLTNVAVCLWSFRKWGCEEQAMRPLFVKRPARSASWN
jgi:hypothetical protein